MDHCGAVRRDHRREVLIPRGETVEVLCRVVEELTDLVKKQSELLAMHGIEDPAVGYGNDIMEDEDYESN